MCREYLQNDEFLTELSTSTFLLNFSKSNLEVSTVPSEIVLSRMRHFDVYGSSQYFHVKFSVIRSNSVSFEDYPSDLSWMYQLSQYLSQEPLVKKSHINKCPI